MSNTIKPGDTVSLKSGGPILTVDRLFKSEQMDYTNAKCVWYDESTGNFRSMTVTVDTVEIVPLDNLTIRKI